MPGGQILIFRMRVSIAVYIVQRKYICKCIFLRDANVYAGINLAKVAGR